MTDAVGLQSQLPAPPPGRTGWPWTVETPPQPAASLPRITVVTPTLNQARTIEETIRSILLQNYPNLQYIVMDGGSTDGTTEILGRYKRWIDLVISEKDRGQSDALNKGFSHADGDVYAYMNSDDYYLPSAFFRVGEVFLKDPGLGLLHGGCRIISETGVLQRVHHGRIETIGEILDLWGVWWARRQFVQPEVFWSAEIMQKAGTFREDLYFTMDYEFWTRLLLAGARVLRVEDEFSAFRLTAEQKSRQSARVARELRQVVRPLLWDESVPLSPGLRSRLKRAWIYDTIILEHVEYSIANGESRTVRWMRLAVQIARHPSLLTHLNLWRRLLAVVSR